MVAESMQSEGSAGRFEQKEQSRLLPQEEMTTLFGGKDVRAQ